jgi:hypothetical protein
MSEAYESPVVLTYGELEFEPANNGGCCTLVVCLASIGNCSSSVSNNGNNNGHQ